MTAMHLTTIFHTGPVTAVCCHDDTVLAGIGSRLYVYSVSDVSKKVDVQVLHGRNIHGIRPECCTGPTRMCIFGQKCIRLIQYSPQGYQLQLVTDILEFTDWIWDVAWLKDIQCLSLALGHNVIVTYNLEKRTVDRSIHCQEKCIVYCAKFITDLYGSLVLAAGTVFNQVVLWSPVSQHQTQSRSKVFHRLTGHQGVIFSVDYEPVSQRICSASDDRSIRLYQVTFPRSTTSPCVEDWENMDSSLLHVLYGHSARVWNVQLLATVFVSVGEDSTCIVWSYDGLVLHKMKGHKGKSVWSMAVNRGENYVVTGGGDHSIRLWNIKSGTDNNSVTTVLPLQIDEEDFPRNTLMFGINRVLVLTNNGLLLLYNYETGQITTLMTDSSFSSYSVLAVSPQAASIAVGNIHGMLRIIQDQDCSMQDGQTLSMTDIHLYEGRLFSIQWLGETTLLTTGPNGSLKLCQLSIDDTSVTVLVTCELELAPSKQRWVSAACSIQGTSYIVCGDRAGSVYTYCVAGEKKNKTPSSKFPKLHGKGGVTSVCCHGNKVYTTGRDGLYRVFSWTEQEELVLMNSNKVYKGLDWIEDLVIHGEEDMHIHGFHTNKFVVWSVRQNQKLLEVECGGGHRAWDFCCHDDKAQFVYIKTRQVVLTEIDNTSDQTILKGSLHGRELCDAKHICSLQQTQGGSCHVWLTCSEDTSICISALSNNNSKPELQTLHTLSGHISSVRCMAVCPSTIHSQNTTVHRKLIFSGGGRAQIKVSRIKVEFPTAGCEDEAKSSTNVLEYKGLSDHESCQTALSHNGCDEEGKQLCSSDNENSKIKQTDRPKNSFVKSSVEHLGGVQLGQSGRRRKKPWRYHVENSDPETRILDLAVTKGTEIDCDIRDSLFFLSLACSDGYVRIHAFDEETKEMSELGSSCYHNHCVLKTCHAVINCDTVMTDIGVTSDTNVTSDAGITRDTDITSDAGITRDTDITSDAGITRDTDITSDAGITRDTDITSDAGITRDTDITSDAGITRDTDITSDADITRDTDITSDAGITRDTDITSDAGITSDDDCDRTTSELNTVRRTVSQGACSESNNTERITDTTSSCYKVVSVSTESRDSISHREADQSSQGLSVAGLSKAGLSSQGLSVAGLSNAGLSNQGLSVGGLSKSGLSSKGRFIVLTAATDGMVGFWDVTDLCKSYAGLIKEEDPLTGHSEKDQMEKGRVQGNEPSSLSQIRPFFTNQLHQSGINSLHFSQQTDGRYLLLTGGDDNAVKVSLVTMEIHGGGPKVKVICQGSHESAHAAQITGIWALSDSTILTASIDQRVCVWGITEETPQIKFKLLDCQFVDVMDIANLDVWTVGDTHHILLCGEGLQLLEIDTSVTDRQTCQPTQSACLVEQTGSR